MCQEPCLAPSLSWPGHLGQLLEHTVTRWQALDLILPHWPLFTPLSNLAFEM